MNSEAARIAREPRPSRRSRATRRGRAASPARSARPTGPRRSRRTSTTPAPATSRSTSSSEAYAEAARGPDRGRRGPPPHRDDLRHAQRQGRDLRRRGGLRATRLAAAADRLGHDHRRLGADAVAARPSRRSGTRCPRAADRRRAELRARRAPAAPVRRGPRPGRRDSRSSPTRTPACRTSSAATTRRPRTTADLHRPLGRRDGLLNIAGGCCGTTPAHVRAIAEAVAGRRAAGPAGDRRRATRLSGLEPLTIPPAGQPVRQRRRADERHRLAPFARLIPEGHFDEAVEVARQQVDVGRPDRST